jgi:hypothetical protein
MYTEAQAWAAFEATREFFEKTLKSSNKGYNPEDNDKDRDARNALAAQKLASATGLTQADALARVVKRDANITPSAQRYAELKDTLNFLGKTPLQFGQALFGSRAPSGNCGAMACVALHLAKEYGVSPANMWLVNVQNRDTKGPAGFPDAGKSMSFRHSWAELGTVNEGGPWIVDPWANICCHESHYERAFRNQAEKWNRQGKRISVGFEGGKPWWFPANDPAVLSLLRGRKDRYPSNQITPP